MARYSLAFTKASVTAAGAVVDLATASTDRARILEFAWSVAAMSGTTPSLDIGLFRSTVIGTRTSPVTTLAEEAADPVGTTTPATAFSVAPTLAANPLRRWTVNAVGGGIIWVWPDRGGLTVPVSSSVVLSVITAAGTTPNFTLSGYIVVDE